MRAVSRFKNPEKKRKITSVFVRLSFIVVIGEFTIIICPVSPKRAETTSRERDEQYSAVSNHNSVAAYPVVRCCVALSCAVSVSIF